MPKSKVGGCIGLILFLGAALVFGQNAPRKPLPTEPLERYGDSPMFIFRNELSSGMISQHGAFTSYQVNVDANGNNITGDAANEPSISVDPTNPNKMTIGWRQFDNVQSNFRQAGWGYTSDGGKTWTFPDVLERGIFRSDPVLASDDTGRFFYLSLLSNFFDDMWRSLNGGQTWTRLAPATGGDKQWFTIDNSGSSGHGFQYQYWSTAGNNYGGRQFTRSIDGGFNWLNPISIPNSPIWGTLDVNTNGDLFLAGVNANNGQIWCLRSTNARNGGVTPTFDLVTPVNLGGDIVTGQINPEGIIGQLFVAVDRSGTSTNNNVYLLASVQPFGFGIGTDVMFVRSSNGGQSFSAPRRINDDPINHSKWHWFGTLSVAPNGRIDSVWLDSRNAANNTDSQLFYSYSKDGGNTWSPNVAVSEPFDPTIGYPNQNKIGDYMTIVSDNIGGNVAYPATFNGEQDIYYARVAPPPSLPLLNISTRVRVLTGEQVLIGGFIITGTDPKQVLIRGIGPSLNGINGVLSDPTLELHQGDTTIATNDNWKTRSDGGSQQAEIEATTIPPTNELESAILVTLTPGTYTAILAGKNGGTGVGVVEVYDLSAGANSRLGNISSRGFVNTNDGAMIGGLIAGPGNPGDYARVLVRALGPSLASSGVQGALQDPTLELHDANGATTATNDNWKINDQSQRSQEAELRATITVPPNDFESVIVTTLLPGPSTAIVRGKNNGTGVALVEVYNLP